MVDDRAAPHIVVIGASAGGLAPLRRLVGLLPGGLPAAVFAVVHMPESSTSSLARLLDRDSALPAQPARHRQPIEPSTVTAAVPGHHLVVEDRRVRLVRGRPEDRHRPAIDVLFHSAARTHGDAVTAVVLSGTLDDGVEGARAVDQHGGRVVVQDPEEAAYPDMPTNVLRAIEGASVLTVDRIAAALEHRPHIAGRGQRAP